MCASCRPNGLPRFCGGKHDATAAKVAPIEDKKPIRLIDQHHTRPAERKRLSVLRFVVFFHPHWHFLAVQIRKITADPAGPLKAEQLGKRGAHFFFCRMGHRIELGDQRFPALAGKPPKRLHLLPLKPAVHFRPRAVRLLVDKLFLIYPICVNDIDRIVPCHLLWQRPHLVRFILFRRKPGVIARSFVSLSVAVDVFLLIQDPNEPLMLVIRPIGHRFVDNEQIKLCFWFQPPKPIGREQNQHCQDHIHIKPAEHPLLHLPTLSIFHLFPLFITHETIVRQEQADAAFEISFWSTEVHFQSSGGNPCQ